MPWAYCHFKCFKSFLLLCTCMLLGVVHMCHGLHVGIRRQLCTWFSPCSSSWVLGLNLGCHACSTGGFSAEPSHYCLVTTRESWDDSTLHYVSLVLGPRRSLHPTCSKPLQQDEHLWSVPFPKAVPHRAQGNFVEGFY